MTADGLSGQVLDQSQLTDRSGYEAGCEQDVGLA